MGFISLNKMRLRDCLDYKNSCKKRDIIICHHGHEKKRLISEDLYWIEKNIGDIRYLGIWNPENKEIVEEKMILERPVVEEKPKPAEGAEGEEPPPPAEEGDQPKKGLDIFDYEWTKPVCAKNLSQWFCKLKSNITEVFHNLFRFVTLQLNAITTSIKFSPNLTNAPKPASMKQSND